ncbi:MAG TPA: tetratricopeptide repeat protein, partial [Longimicrobiales bacterium]
QDYQSTAELASALQATHAAVQKTLRYLLRADKGAPDDLRLAALSPDEMAPSRLIPALRQRGLISLDLAGQVHELEQAAHRAQTNNVRPSDADHGVRVVDQLRAEVQHLAERKQESGERNVREVAHGTVEAGALKEVHTVPPATESRRPMRLIVAAIGVLVLLLLVWLVAIHKSPTERGIAQFNARDYNTAERTLSGVVNDDPGNADAAYYLAKLYRGAHRYDDAARVLRRAIEKTPNDPYLHEEMGNLFMVLKHPELAAKQYRTSQTLNPKNPVYWVRLVQALRAAGDPEADVVAQQAPAEARAMLGTTP